MVALSLVVAGATGCSAGGGPPEQVARPTRATEVVDFPVGSWRRLPLSPPVRMETPGIGVSSPLVRLGLNPDRTMQVPGDHRVVRFRVDSLASYPKQSLPGEEVYGTATAPVLRLTTCAGTFDRAQRGYRENLVVSATRVADGGTEAGR